MPRQKIAVIGAGVAGLSAAWLLDRQHDISLYEKAPRLGGHAHTMEVDHDGVKHAFDAGFMLFSRPGQPNFSALLDHLGVPTLSHPLSFSASIGGSSYSNLNAAGLFASPSLFFTGEHWRMLGDIRRFNQKVPLLLGREVGWDVAELLRRLKVGRRFADHYLMPLMQVLCQWPAHAVLSCPANRFARLLHGNGLLALAPSPNWHTVKGGSREYINRIAGMLAGKIHLDAPVRSISRDGAKVCVVKENGGIALYDQVIIATHADVALALLGEPGEAERELLGMFTYQSHSAVLHSDDTLMPRRRKAWASCNALSPSSISYWLDRLHQLDASRPLFLTHNPPRQPEAAKLFSRYDYRRPLFTPQAFAAQQRLQEIQGNDRIWYCGSYHGNGLQEDALASAIGVATLMGVKAPWHQ